MYLFFYTCTIVNIYYKTEISNENHASLSICRRYGIEMKGMFINLYIFYYTSNSTFLIHAYMYTLSIIRMFIVTLLKITNFRS